MSLPVYDDNWVLSQNDPNYKGTVTVGNETYYVNADGTYGNYSPITGTGTYNLGTAVQTSDGIWHLTPNSSRNGASVMRYLPYALAALLLFIVLAKVVK